MTYLIIFWQLNYAMIISDPRNDNIDKYTMMPQQISESSEL